jgi:integrase
VSDETRKKQQAKLPRGIHRMADGRFRLYVTRQGKPVRVIVSWALLAELKVPMLAPTRNLHPGLNLATSALIKLQSKILEEERTGVVEASAKTKIADLFPLIEQDYRQRKLKSLGHVQGRWENHLKNHFGNIVAGELSSEDINDYIFLRTEEEVEAATVNRETSVIQRMLRLGQRTKPVKVRTIPYFPRMAEAKARQGFLSDETYYHLAQECSAEGLWLRGMFEVGCNYGWRKTEVLSLQVRQLDLVGRAIRLEPGSTKNDDGRTVRMTNDVYQILSACASGKAATDFVFTRSNGLNIRDFRLAWSNACERAGCPDLLFHDLRRTAARNLRRLGVSEGVIMKIGGWRTRAVFERYNIVDDADLADAARRLDEKRELELGRATSETDTKTDNSTTGAERRVQ